MQWSFGNIHGNVKTLLQDNRKMATNFTSLASQRYKRLDYSYDLVSGNVHRMSVQNGEVDQWHHAYQYDADNRITAAYTNSQTPIIESGQLSSALENELAYNSDWENDAKYFYYAHGPLARTEIGNDELQGYDYFYNLQGWMKGINTMENSKDLGQDGYSGVNGSFAKDITAFSLSYFNNDYVAISGGNITSQIQSSSHPASNSSELFNGNIRYMQTRLTNPNTKADMPMLNAYKYDQLNRLKESRSYETGLTSNVWNPTTYGNAYYNAFSYDAMGNIENQIRHDRNGDTIDNLTYHYQKSGGKLVKNRLYHLNDAQTNASAFTDDIDNMLTFRSDVNRLNTNNNYNYDEEGRLVKDSSERISKIVWRVDGKVKEIQRNSGSTKWLKFDYDAMGNRIAKHVFNNTGTTLERSTYYVLDAQGNQISTYDHDVVEGTARFNLKERNIFGSSRLGSKQDSMNVLTATITQNYSQVLGTKYYEFSNHLGNVLMVYNDVKVGVDANTDGIVDGFVVGITNSSDYSPFGVQLDGRTISKDFYRRGFNGMEKDDEVKGSGNSYDFGARMFDSRVGRWLTIDPMARKYPFSSSYCFVVNTPTQAIDPNGKYVVFPNQISIEKANFWLNEIGIGNEFRINKKGVLKKNFTPFKKNDELTKAIYKKVREIHVYEISYTESLNWMVETNDIPSDRDVYGYVGCGNMVVVSAHFEPAPIITYMIGKSLVLNIISKEATIKDAEDGEFEASESSTFIGLLLDEPGMNSKYENIAREKQNLKQINEQKYDVGETNLSGKHEIDTSATSKKNVINRDEHGDLNDYSSKLVGHQ